MSKKTVLSAVTFPVAAALLLVGCSTAAPPTTAGGESGGKLTLAIDNPALLEPVVAEFTKKYPEIDAEVLPIGSNGYTQVLQTQLASGTAPDVFMVYPGTGEPLTNQKLGERGLLKPLKGDWIEKLGAANLSLLEYDGEVNAIPGTLASIGITYNDQALAAIGAKPAESFDEVLALCDSASAAGTALFSAGQKDAWVGQIVPWAIAVPMIYGPNPDFSSDLVSGDTSFAKGGWEQVFDRVDELITRKCFNEGAVGTGWTDAQKLLADGEVLATVNYGVSKSLADMTPDGTTYTYTAFPAGEKGDPAYMPIAPSKGFAINAKAKNPDAAEKFIEFMATDEGQTAFANASGLAPALDAPSFEPDAASAYMLDVYTQDLGRPYPHLFWPNGATIEALYNGMQNLYIDKTTPSEIVSSLDAAFAG